MAENRKIMNPYPQLSHIDTDQWILIRDIHHLKAEGHIQEVTLMQRKMENFPNEVPMKKTPNKFLI